MQDTEWNTLMHRQTIDYFKKKKDLKFLMYTKTFLKSMDDISKWDDSSEYKDNASKEALTCISDAN